MNILYDSQIFDSQNIGGISRYFFELISAFEKDDEINWTLPIEYSDNEYLKYLPALSDVLQRMPIKKDHYQQFFWGRDFFLKSFFYRVKNKVYSTPKETDIRQKNRENCISQLKNGDFDLFHPTYFDNYFLEFINEKPFVVTVYDLIHQIFPEFGMYETKDKNEDMLNKAQKIIAISESTKSDLVNLFNIPEEKILVTYLANSLNEPISKVSEDFKSKIPNIFLLFVGWRGAYKNFLFFTQVIAALKQENLFVVCTGSPFNSDEKFLFNKLSVSNQFIHTFVNDDELVYLYQHAQALIFPSQYEGFGLPILEAMKWGCPVLTSNSSSLKEIGEDAVIYFEPKNASSMLSSIRAILSDNDLKKKKAAQGIEQVKKFSWERTAAETKKIYIDILQKV